VSIRLIVGLGNPGRDYAETRHNIGFMVLDAYAESRRASWSQESKCAALTARVRGPGGTDVRLMKPLSYMNESGRPVGAYCRYHRIAPEEVVVVYDELNLDCGVTKLTVSGSAGGHNGIASLLEHLGNGFRRFRIGIGPRHPPEIDLKDYVLGKLTPEQREIINRNMPHYIAGLNLLLQRGTEAAMNILNRRSSPNDRSNHQQTV